MEMDHDTDQRRDHKRPTSENHDKDGIPYKRRRPRIDNISIVSSTSSSFPVASGLTNNAPITVSSFGSPSTLDHKDLGCTPESSGTSFMEAGKGFAADNLVYDACFGRIQVTAMLRTSLHSKSPELSVDPSGPLLKLSTTNPVKHVGIVMAPELSMLTQKFRVTLTATLSPTEYRHMEGEKKPTPYAQGSIRVLVYGFRSEQNEVAKVLSQGDLYLQDPFIGEIDSRVPYINPQYLLRPGSSMLEIAELLPSDNKGSQKSYDFLSEAEKNRLLAIFQTETRAVDITAIQPSQRIRTLLKDHQLTALAFMIEKEVGNMNQPKFSTLWTKLQDEAGRERYQHIVTGKCEEGYPVSLCGGILADEMGLGKTLTTLALVCWHLDSIDSQPRTSAVAESCMLRHSLVVAPKSTIHQWQKQIETHLRPGSLRHLIYHGPNKHQTLPNWKSQDVILTSYDTIRSEWRRNGPLFRHSWARVILDEAHTVRNRTSKLFQAVCAIQAQRRWCLTGTPIHNRLDDFGALLSFIRVPPFFTRESFEMWITRPVKSKRNNALQTLRKLVLATCLRRTKPSSNGSLTLPQKTEKVEALVLDEEERALYSFFQRKAFSLAGDPLDRSSSTPPAAAILPLIGTLRLICNHGQYLLSQKALSAWRKKDASRIDWNLFLSMVEKCITCDMTADYTGDIDPIEFPCSHVMCATCSNANEADVLESLKHNCCPKCLQKENMPRFIAATQCDDSRTKSYYKASTKVKALVRNLRVELSQPLPAGKMNPFKSIVFSYWTKMLDLVMIALEVNGLSFTRVDGRASLPKRIQALDTFNNDPNCQIMLASIGSIGEGVDLTAANHVHILEPQWNPMTEAQAVDRIHRIGQERDVVITRYFIQNSIEDYVRFVQKEKLRLIEQSLSVSNTQQLQMEKVRWKVLLETLG